MTLGQQIAGELMQMGGAEMPLALQMSDSGCSASMVVCQWSPLAVGVESIQVQCAPDRIDSREHAERLAKKLNYLSEPVRVLEIDAASRAAQLRSDPPRKIDEDVEYFELQVASSAVRLFRFRSHAGEPRASMAFTLTLETVARLVDDMTAP